MLDALGKLGIGYVFAPENDDPDFESKSVAHEKQGELIDAAWRLAKENDFYVE